MWVKLENKRQKRILLIRKRISYLIWSQSLRMQGTKATIAVLELELVNILLL